MNDDPIAKLFDDLRACAHSALVRDMFAQMHALVSVAKQDACTGRSRRALEKLELALTQALDCIARPFREAEAAQAARDAANVSAGATRETI